MALVLALAPAKQAAAATIYTEGDYEYYLSSGSAVISSYTGSDSTVTIPTKLGGYPVVQIGASAFEGNTKLGSLTISENVTVIGKSAFSGCTNLKNLVLGKSLVYIYAYAFEDCTALETITVKGSISYSGYSNGVSGTAYGAFQNAGSKSSGITVAYKSSATKVAEGMFYTKDSDESPNVIAVSLGSAVTEIGGNAFNGVATLTSINWGSALTEIGTGAFKDCTGLVSISFPSTVETIHTNAFKGCTGLTKLVFPKGLTAIYRWAFMDCTGLQSITVKSKKLYVGWSKGTSGVLYGAFQNAGSATSGMTVTFTSTCTTMPNGMFCVEDMDEVPNVSKVVISYATDKISIGFLIYLGDVTIYGYKGSPAHTFYQKYKDTYGFTWKTKAYDASDLTVTLSTSTYTYNGKARKPTVTVKAGSIELSSSYYKVSYEGGRKAVGKYKVTVTGTSGVISGSTSVYFKIVPKKVTVKSVKSSAAKKATVKWTKLTSSTVTKYQIRYRVKGTSTWKKVTVSSSKSSYTLTGLKSGKTYQVQVRAYKTRSGTNYVGSWSSTKTVTVK